MSNSLSDIIKNISIDIKNKSIHTKQNVNMNIDIPETKKIGEFEILDDALNKAYSFIK